MMIILMNRSSSSIKSLSTDFIFKSGIAWVYDYRINMQITQAIVVIGLGVFITLLGYFMRNIDKSSLVFFIISLVWL